MVPTKLDSAELQPANVNADLQSVEAEAQGLALLQLLLASPASPFFFVFLLFLYFFVCCAVFVSFFFLIFFWWRGGGQKILKKKGAPQEANGELCPSPEAPREAASRVRFLNKKQLSGQETTTAAPF